MSQLPPEKTSNSGYGQEAAVLIGQYESLRFEQVHAPVLHLFPAAPARVLDIGAGSGRDAGGLAALGHTVTAVEPTAELRSYGERAHSNVRWLDDALPSLPRLRALDERFDLVMLTAVWMHLDAQERAQAMDSLAALTAPGGRVAMTLRHGPVPESRRMFEVSGEETAQLAAPHGFSVVAQLPNADAQGRPDVHWTFLVLQLRG
jgi:SAM-dependent methyltransferase